MVLSAIDSKWDKPYFADEPYSNFSRDGHMSRHMIVGDENFKLKLLEDVPKEETGGSEMGQIASVTNHEIVQKERGKMQDEGRKFKVGDRVFSFHYGLGVIEDIFNNYDPFSMIVHWDKDSNKAAHPDTRNSYTLDGKFYADDTDSPRDIILVDEEESESTVEKKPDAKSIEEDKKFMAECKKIDEEGKKFKVGERVWSPYFGGGTVVTTESEAGAVFPIEVDWDDKHLGAFDYFTEDGKYTVDGEQPEMGIYHIDPEAAAKSLPNIMEELADDEEDDDEGTVERMEEGLNKKVEDAINPSHYRVEGLPEAIDIINHLMHRCQLEGFLWGNILKYAYRYGRKGDKAETAGKIEWYARQLKELCECEAEKEEGDKK